MDTAPPSSRAVPAGWLHIEAAVARLIVAGELGIAPCLRRHLSGDFGELTEIERRENKYVMENGGEVLSVYRISDSLTVWIVSEWNLCSSTVMLPPRRGAADRAVERSRRYGS